MFAATESIVNLALQIGLFLSFKKPEDSLFGIIQDTNVAEFHQIWFSAVLLFVARLWFGSIIVTSIAFFVALDRSGGRISRGKMVLLNSSAFVGYVVIMGLIFPFVRGYWMFAWPYYNCLTIYGTLAGCVGGPLAFQPLFSRWLRLETAC
jgi:hypothetical protein